MPAAMLSRPSSMSSSALFRCDIFCNVIDNYGDIGVCWRLARQLSLEYDWSVRLWVDEFSAFSRICPEFDASLVRQQLRGVEVCHWGSDFQNVIPGDFVIEAFACHLPESFVKGMAHRARPPVWINLDYLSAETWVSGCHALPSPHPSLPLTKYFFFPGFDQTTGGLLREAGLSIRRDSFCASASAQAAFWQRFGWEVPTRGRLKVSIFAYENPALPALLSTLAQSQAPVSCFAPLTRTRGDIEAFLGRSVNAGDVIGVGNLELRVLPFVSQEAYDELLWSCDINFVRGEDSFVRAQWAAKPMLWQIYPQSDQAHFDKLKAFLDRYLEDLTPELSRILRRLFLVWNGFADFSSITVCEGLTHLDDFSRHAERWEKHLSKQRDLCASLVSFCKSKL